MIIVVEGPTASGKTTWVQTHARDVAVAEATSTAVPPPETTARSWAERGAGRWEEALSTEGRAGIAVCDTDPLKVHYSWSLWRVGAGTRSDFERHADAYREMMALDRLGFADAYFVSIPQPGELERRMSGDHSRRRRNFELHVRLGEPLRQWYTALEEVRPGSVLWGFPDGGLGRRPPDGRHRRYDLETYDALIGLATRRALTG